MVSPMAEATSKLLTSLSPPSGTDKCVVSHVSVKGVNRTRDPLGRTLSAPMSSSRCSGAYQILHLDFRVGKMSLPTQTVAGTVMALGDAFECVLNRAPLSGMLR